MDDEEFRRTMDDFTKIKACQRYMQILKDYDLENDLAKDLTYIFESIEQIVSMLPNSETTDLNTVHNDINMMYWATKYLANVVNFVNTMKPIVRHFNPSDEDKARFVEYIKKMEEKDDK